LPQEGQDSVAVDICRRRDRRVAVPLFEMTREDLAECKPVTFTHLEIKAGRS